MPDWNAMVTNGRRRRSYGTVADVQGAQDELIDRDMQAGDAAGDEYMRRASGFDATAALNKYAQGAWGSVSEGLNATLRGAAGRAVGAGRFDSGFYDEDQGEIIRGTMDDFSNNLAMQSLTAAGMDQRNMEGMASYGSQRSDRGTDLLMSRSEQVQNDARENEERKRRKRSGVGSAIGTALGGVGGFILSGGNPAGAAMGGRLGGSIGGSF